MEEIRAVAERLRAHAHKLHEATTVGGLSGSECATLSDDLQRGCEQLLLALASAPPTESAPRRFDIGALTVNEASKVIATADADMLEEIERQERAGKDRDGVQGAIDKRREELTIEA